jgi:hypothetical protein
MVRAILFACVLSMAMPILAQTIQPIYTAGPNVGPTPQEYPFVVQTPSGKKEGYYRAGPDGLGVRVTVENEVYAPHPAPVAAIQIRDIIITGDEPGALVGVVTLPLDYDAIYFGPLSAGSTVVDISVTATQVFVLSDVRNIDAFPVNTTISTGPMEVPLNVPIGLGVGMRVGAAGTGTVDASKSLRFNREAVFDLEPGFTANSVSWGLVNNRLVPEPSSIWLLAGMGAMLLGRRRARV